MRTRFPSRLAAASLALLASAWPSAALDANDVGEKLKSALEGSGLSMHYGDVGGNGSTVTLSDVVLTGPSADPNRPAMDISLGDIELHGVGDDRADAYTVESISLGTIRVKDGDSTVTIARPSFMGVTIPHDASGRPARTMLLYEKASAGPLTIETPGLTPISIREISGSLVADGEFLNFTSDAVGFAVDPSLSGLLDSEPARRGLELLGIRTLEGNVHMEGTWQPSDGHLVVADAYVDVESAGKLGVRFDIVGCTADFASKLRSFERAHASGADASLERLELSGALRSFKLQSAAVYFQDWGLTGALLDGAAREQGVSTAQMAITVEAMVPFLAAHIQPRALAEQIVSAAQGFLADPDSISIQANPSTPVIFGDLIDAASLDPLRVPALLGLSASAND